MNTNRVLVTSALTFVAKSITFTVIFWAIWYFVLYPIAHGPSDRTSEAAQVSDNALRATAEKQAKESEALQSQYKGQMEEAAAALKRQAGLLDRWEKIIERWEANAPRSK